MEAREERPDPRGEAPEPPASVAIARLFREEHGRILATLIRFLGDFDAAEEALQDGFATACERWPRTGTPPNPVAWVTLTARNRALDRLRRQRVLGEKKAELQALARLEAATEEEAMPLSDDRLRLLFTCCHPALAPEAQVALALRTVCGLTTPELARAFLVPEATLQQRIVRAKRKIRDAGIPYRVPTREELPARFASVLAVVYLVFNEGYAATAGEGLLRPALCEEAIRLARLLVELMPGEDEAAGLLALMLLHDSRRDARTGPGGEFIALKHHDRSRWRRAAIDEALALLAPDPPGGSGPYRLQALISACHARAASWGETDWREVIVLYDALAEAMPGPVVELNRIVAYSMVAGAVPALQELEAAGLAAQLEQFQPYHAARADLLRRANRPAEALAAYDRAIALSANLPERAFLAARRAALTP